MTSWPPRSTHFVPRVCSDGRSHRQLVSSDAMSMGVATRAQARGTGADGGLSPCWIVVMLLSNRFEPFLANRTTATPATRFISSGTPLSIGDAPGVVHGFLVLNHGRSNARTGAHKVSVADISRTRI